MITLHAIKHLIAAMVAVSLHVVHHAGMAAAHAVSSKATGMGEAMVLVMMRKRGLM